MICNSIQINIIQQFTYIISYQYIQMNNSLLFAGLSGIVLAGLAGSIALFEKHKNHHHKHKLKQFPTVWTLIGDIGGTNIRLQLVKIQPPHDQPIERKKSSRVLVIDHPSFQQCIKQFLHDVDHQHYPNLAMIAIAGPVTQNTVRLANIEKWNQLNGNQLGQKLRIQTFKFLNDFQANSYGLALVKDEKFLSLNGKTIIKDKVKGVLGPGTGLGCSLLYEAPLRNRTRTYVLPSQSGHTDLISHNDDEIKQYYQFMKKATKRSYISRQRAFCGPALPYMFRFYAQKYPDKEGSNLHPNPKEIIIKFKETRQNKESLYTLVVELFLKLYFSVIANFISQTYCCGGLYLVGNLTNAIHEQLLNRDILEDFFERFPDRRQKLKDIPIVFCQQIQLGLLGSFVIARRSISDHYYNRVRHHPKRNMEQHEYQQSH